MAIATVFIPDGEFCSDEHHLGCMYEDHVEGYHHCKLYGEGIGKIQTFTVNGETRRAFLKCAQCLANMKEDSGKGLKPDDTHDMINVLRQSVERLR